ncbi:MAG: gfo/Idh/MocA family oxidoreductase, partial [Acidobacteria bacterium]|nr:gfo/Idh/MocA family oxidoreductase [Acidobacteriota bacterium]
MADALKAGKHVFCEKSLVFKPEEVHGLRQL